MRHSKGQTARARHVPDRVDMMFGGLMLVRTRHKSLFSPYQVDFGLSPAWTCFAPLGQRVFAGRPTCPLIPLTDLSEILP